MKAGGPRVALTNADTVDVARTAHVMQIPTRMDLRPPALCLLLLACPSIDEGDETPPPEVPAPVDDGYGHCPQETRVGGFAVQPATTYTTFVGAVADGVVPATILDALLTGGDCALLHPRTLFCDPGCDAGFVCDVGGECVPSPANVDIGAVAVEGLGGPVDVEAIPPTNIYNFTGDLPFPAYAPGDRVELYTGDDRLGPSMVAYGVDDLEVGVDTVPLDPDVDLALTWTPPATDLDARVHVEVNIANHGGVPAKIVCETADDGDLVVGADVVTGLLDVGWSGFPSVTLTRRSSDVADTDDGCFDFTVQSVVALPAEIPGLTSCSGPDDCPPDQDCLPDLTCG